jgi:hypothetical protein
MSLIATPFVVVGVGRIIEIGELNKVGEVNTISVKIESERRRMSGANQIIEHDSFFVQIWDTGADVFKDRAKVGYAMNFTGELRNKKGVVTLKINKFEIYGQDEQK